MLAELQVNQPLRHRNRNRCGIPCDIHRESLHSIEQLGVGPYLADDSELQGLLRAENPPRKQQVTGLSESNLTRQKEGRKKLRHRGPPRENKSHPRALGRNPYIE